MTKAWNKKIKLTFETSLPERDISIPVSWETNTSDTLFLISLEEAVTLQIIMWWRACCRNSFIEVKQHDVTAGWSSLCCISSFLLKQIGHKGPSSRLMVVFVRGCECVCMISLYFYIDEGTRKSHSCKGLFTRDVCVCVNVKRHEWFPWYQVEVFTSNVCVCMSHREWVWHPFCMFVFPSTQCDVDADADAHTHANANVTCKQSLK